MEIDENVCKGGGGGHSTPPPYILNVPYFAKKNRGEGYDSQILGENSSKCTKMYQNDLNDFDVNFEKILQFQEISELREWFFTFNV